ncbi:MAG: aminopeptidase P family protein [Polyangiales bacterium]
MSTWPTPVRPDALALRRTRLANALGDVPALLCAGRARPRNYPANRYPFRAESHFLYLAGLSLPGAAILVERAKSTLLVPAPAADDALWHGHVASFADLQRATGVDEVVAIERFADVIGPRARTVATLPVHEPQTAAWQSEALARAVPACSGTRVAGSDELLADAMIELRLVHDDAAVDQMKQAAAVTARAHQAGMKALRPGVREAVVRAAIESEFAAHGMSPAYGSIVTVHGEVLHNEAYGNVVQPNDLLLVDAGAEGPDGWCADVTRVWPASGTFTGTQRALYEIVLAAQRKAISMVHAGTRYRAIHTEAGRTIIAGLVDLGVLKGSVDGLLERGAYTLFFPHGVGHLIGLDVHDMEDLGDRAGYARGRTRSPRFGDAYLRLDRDLVAGMAVTIEPGIYLVPAILDDPARTAPFAGDLDRTALARFADVRGIRLEDDVLCTGGEPEVLTRAIPIEIGEVEAAMRKPG